MIYSGFNIKRLEAYGFAEADLLSRKTKIKTYRRSSLRGKLNALSKKPFAKWLRQSPTRVNPRESVSNPFCAFSWLYLCSLCPLWLKINQSKMTFYAKQTQFS